jgi:hypothetical protein
MEKFMEALIAEQLDDVDFPFTPIAPKKPEDLDVPRSLVEDIILRHLYIRASSSIKIISNTVKLPFSLVMTIFQDLRQRQLFEIMGMEGNDYEITLSGKGRELAAKRFNICHYTGPAPVSVDSYFDVVRKQAAATQFDQEFLQNVFSDLVLTENFLDQLGPALISNKSIFLYGPTGNGKTSVAIQLAKIYRDTILIPYAVEYDGQIIVMYDPAVHEKIDTVDITLDTRWIPCKRPCIIVGGELEPKMLELQMEESSKVYAAPVQMRANNGILVIDDFGRQIVTPHYLLNRWIVPLDRRVDFLSLQYGVKFEIPFEMVVVFSTNLDPNDLADEAFLRRIQNKIYVAPVGPEVFDRIYHRLVETNKFPAAPGSTEYLRKLCRHYTKGQLRACYPRDILDIIASICRYKELPVEINKQNLKQATDLYFTKTETVAAEER